MAWEWVAPIGTVLGAFGGAFAGGRVSRRNQRIQRGLTRADEAVEALHFLKANRYSVASISGGNPKTDVETRCEHELVRLRSATGYLLNEQARTQVSIACDAIADAWLIHRFGKGDVDTPDTIIWRACGEALEVLERYVRNQKVGRPSEYTAELKRAYDSAYDEMERQRDAANE